MKNSNNILILLALLTLCQSKVNNITINHDQLRNEIDTFINDVEKDSEETNKNITVQIVTKDSVTKIYLMNFQPKTCSKIQGMVLVSKYQVFVISDTSYSSLFTKVGRFHCPISEKKLNDLNPPNLIHYRERVYHFDGETISLINK